MPALCLWAPARGRQPSPRAQPADTSSGNQESPAGWPSPLAPASPAATHHFPAARQQPLAFPRAPLRTARRSPSFLPPRQAESPPQTNAGRGGPARDRGRRAARLKISRNISSRLLLHTSGEVVLSDGSGPPCQNALLKFKPVLATL